MPTVQPKSKAQSERERRIFILRMQLNRIEQYEHLGALGKFGAELKQELRKKLQAIENASD